MAARVLDFRTRRVRSNADRDGGASTPQRMPRHPFYKLVERLQALEPDNDLLDFFAQLLRTGIAEYEKKYYEVE